MKKIKLKVLGISYSQTQSGAYALVLNEEDGNRRIPIIIGGFEAQSIVIKLEGLNPPRPLTHDLFKNFSDSFNINLLEVNIYRLEEGVFYSRLICHNGESEVVIDSRTSDAVALALRFECPIYITEDIMERAGIVIKPEKEDEESEFIPRAGKDPEEASDTRYDSHSLAELQDMLDEAIKAEDYEGAAVLKKEIEKRQKDKS